MAARFASLNFSSLNESLLYLNLFFLQSYLIRFQIGPYPTNLQEVLLALQAVLFLGAVLRGGRFMEMLRGLRHHWVLLTFAALSLTTIFTLPLENGLDFFRHSRFLACALLLSFVFAETLRSDEQRMNGFRFLTSGALLFGIFSLLWNLAGQNVTYDYRLQGPLDSAVYLSYYLTPFFLFSVFDLFEHHWKKEELWKNYITIALFLLLIIGTRSLGSLVGGFAVLALYFYKRSDLNFFRKGWLKVAAVFCGLILVTAIFVVKILPSLQTHNTSLGERNEIWATSVELLRDPGTVLFGLGLGQFEANYINNVDRVLGHKPLDYNILQPHNIFLLFIFQFGILGLLFLFFCMGRLAFSLSSAEGRTHGVMGFFKKDKPFGVSAVAGFLLLYFFLHGLIDTPFFKNDLLILMVLFMEVSFQKRD